MNAPVCSTAVKLEMRSYFLSFLDRFRLCPSRCLYVCADVSKCTIAA